eukprot:364868-Chlamydomonas_euryale.AAC.3
MLCARCHSHITLQHAQAACSMQVHTGIHTHVPAANPSAALTPEHTPVAIHTSNGTDPAWTASVEVPYHGGMEAFHIILASLLDTAHRSKSPHLPPVYMIPYPRLLLHMIPYPHLLLHMIPYPHLLRHMIPDPHLLDARSHDAACQVCQQLPRQRLQLSARLSEAASSTCAQRVALREARVL